MGFLGQLIQMFFSGANPLQIVMQLMGMPDIMSNPMASNALNMAKDGNGAGLEQMARNVCNSNGIDADQMANQIRQNIPNILNGNNRR